MASKVSHNAAEVQRKPADAKSGGPALSKGAKLARDLAGQGFAAQAAALTPGEPDKKPGTGGAGLTGRFVVSGSWDSFREWHLQFANDELVDSHTDDLGASDWPTQMSKSGSLITLTQTTEASDATLTEVLTLRAIPKAGGGYDLEAVSATTTTVDRTDDNSVSSRSQGGLTVQTLA